MTDSFVIQPFDTVTVSFGDDALLTTGVVIVPGPAGPQGATGPAGATGPVGATGPNGNAYTGPGWFFGNGAPGNIAGSKNTDLYFDLDTGYIYTKTNGSWVQNGSISGPQGVQGVQGVQGPTGPTGAQGVQGPTGAQGIQGAPGVSLDINGTVATYALLPPNPSAGDAYVVAADGKLYFYDGTAYPANGDGVPFVGPQGPIGAQGVQGPQGVQGAQGLQGPAGDNGAQGPQGIQGATGPAGATGDTGPAGPSTVSDTVFTLQDNADATKQARFELSAISTATTRTFTLPNVTSTVEVTANKGQANGYASLGSDGRVPLAQWSYPVVDGGSPSSSTNDVLDGGTP